MARGGRAEQLEHGPIGDVLAIHEDLAGAGAQPGDDLRELRLAVPGDPRESQDLA